MAELKNKSAVYFISIIYKGIYYKVSKRVIYKRNVTERL